MAGAPISFNYILWPLVGVKSALSRLGPAVKKRYSMIEKMRQEFTELTASSRETASKLGAIWCRSMHDSPMWPIHGQYQCRTCGRHYSVPWSAAALLPAHAPIRQAHYPSFRSALLPLIIMLAMLAPGRVRAAEAPAVVSLDPAAMAFARYLASQAQAAPWSVESIVIDASLPQSRKQGRLRAIRHLLPLGKPEYQVLEIEGDATVRRQVIARYLSAQIEAQAIPAASIAITPANYKFTYKGPVNAAGGVAYAFLIKPRKKLPGLIKGELWLDGETGAVVRQSGYLVKNPSIFVRRINVTRETLIRAGFADELTTYLSVDTRLVGRAELTIHEHPWSDRDSSFASGIEE
jgi:hypothetical protein